MENVFTVNLYERSERDALIDPAPAACTGTCPTVENEVEKGWIVPENRLVLIAVTATNRWDDGDGVKKPPVGDATFKLYFAQ